MDHIATFCYASEVRQRHLCHVSLVCQHRIQLLCRLFQFVFGPQEIQCNLWHSKPDPIFRGKRCPGLARAVDDQWQRSKREGRRSRWGPSFCYLGDCLSSGVNLMPSQDAVSNGANSMSPCPSAYPHIPLISHHPQRKTTSSRKQNLGTTLNWSV